MVRANRIGNGWSKLGRYVSKSQQDWSGKAAWKVANKIRETMRHQIATSGGGDWPANSPLTVALKGFNRPWYRYGRLYRGIHVKKQSNGWFVGWEGRDAMIANVLEYGAAIPVTPGVRGWMASKGIFLKASTTKLYIPPRPLLGRLQQEAKRGGELANLAISEIKKEWN